jgi:hypothetical protein
MIQFNLLPDIKVQYLKSKRRKHTVVVSSVIASIVSVALLVLLLAIVHGVQKKSLSDLNADIKTKSTELQSTPDLTKVLTIQNQLQELSTLHDGKPVATRMYDYLSQVTPNDISINKADVDFQQSAISLSGSAKDLATINKFVDTLKFTKYSTASGAQNKEAFTKVVLTNFGTDNNKSTYTVTFAFDPVIFQQTEEVKLEVPDIISTRSKVERPAALFQDTEEAN